MIGPVHEGADVGGFVGKDAGFEIAFVGMFCSESGAGEIGGGDEGSQAIDDNRLGMDAGTKGTLEQVAFDQDRIFIEILPEAGPGFFRVDNADGDPVLHEVRENGEKGDGAPSPDDMHVFDIGGDDPQEFPGAGNFLLDDPGVDFRVEDEFGHAGGCSHAGEGRVDDFLSLQV